MAKQSVCYFVSGLMKVKNYALEGIGYAGLWFVQRERDKKKGTAYRRGCANELFVCAGKGCFSFTDAELSKILRQVMEYCAKGDRLTGLDGNVGKTGAKLV